MVIRTHADALFFIRYMVKIIHGTTSEESYQGTIFERDKFPFRKISLVTFLNGNSSRSWMNIAKAPKPLISVWCSLLELRRLKNHAFVIISPTSY